MSIAEPLPAGVPELGPRGTMTPTLHRVVDSERETAETITLVLEPLDEPLPAAAPGQFLMLWTWGVGEVPISVSAVPTDGTLVHTIRDAGGVTRNLCALERGDVVGARGPFGVGWDLAAADGRDLVIVAGGIGLAPLRPVVRTALAERDRFRDVFLVVGSRTVPELLYRAELDGWWRHGVITVRTIVDRASPGWAGNVGVVTAELERLPLDPAETVAMVCGPEVMMRVSAQHLVDSGVPAAQVQVSLERNMQCAVRTCGHCQLGPFFACSDGPVLGWDVVGDYLMVREL